MPVQFTLLNLQLCFLPDTLLAWSVTSSRASIAVRLPHHYKAKPASISLSAAWIGAFEYEFEIVLDPLESSDVVHAIAEVGAAEVEVKQWMDFVDVGLVVAAVELASSNDASVVDPRFDFTFNPWSSLSICITICNNF